LGGPAADYRRQMALHSDISGNNNVLIVHK
jgi:hypothetical protein